MSTLSPEIIANWIAGIAVIVAFAGILLSIRAARATNKAEKKQHQSSLRDSLNKLILLPIPGSGCSDFHFLKEARAQYIEITNSLRQLAKPRYAKKMENIFKQFNSTAQEWGNNQGYRLYGKLQSLAKKILTELDDW